MRSIRRPAHDIELQAKENEHGKMLIFNKDKGRNRGKMMFLDSRWKGT